VFSGIVTEVGRVVGLRRSGSAVAFTIGAPGIAGEVRSGDSVAVNGVCQTVTSAGGGSFAFVSVAATLKATNLSELRPGSRVNVEPALRLGDRLSGHLVSGHIDGTGVVRSRRERGRDNIDFTIQVPDAVRPYVAVKGSIALDGVSLTVQAVRGSIVGVTVIPYTLATTVLRRWRPGSRVNIEADQVAKYAALRVNAKGGGQV
jgi:riboflavin synthase alpha subunit